MARNNAKNFLDDGEFNLPKLEEKILVFWDKQKIFEKSLAKNKRKKFVFYEGPPYANGKPGIHHVLARVVKDVMLRYKTMRGYYVPRRAGWDTHGLPVEMAAEKALGFKSKKDIEKYGVKQFNEKAKEQVWIHKDEWERITRRIGYWLDLKNAYVTYAPEYIETIWWTLAEIWKRKLLSKGHKVVQWCTRCGTALSSHELAQGYKEVTENSVYVKFHLKPGQQFGEYATKDSAYILSWTTTPWTLPGNVALAVGERISYAALRVEGVPELYIVASDLAKTIFKDKSVEIVHDDLKGKDLVGLEYEPLFDIKAFHGNAAAYKVHSANFVTTTDGTGIVHTAVMYGEDDYKLGKKIGLPEHHTVDEEGKFTKDVPGFTGDYVKAKETEEKIFKHLERNGNLLRIEPYTHEYPHCWRCGTPVLYYARTSWFIGMSKLRTELLRQNKKINWMPAHVKEGRFGEWLREVKDWNLSRERYWGAPLPIWECKKCAHTEVVSSIDELSRLAGGASNRYWVMRHGEAESNMFNIIDSGQNKFLHLTPRGRKQVEVSIGRFERELAKRREKIDLVITSDVTRAKETEKIDVSVLTGERTIVDRRLEEIHLGPTLTGYRDKTYHEKFPTYESRFNERPEGGESLRDLRTRAWDFLRDCETKYKGKNILLVSHDYPIWMLTHAGEGWSEERAIAEKEKKGNDFIRFAEIRELRVKKIPRGDTGMIDLHRPFVDEIFLPCTKCGGTMKRVLEVADVWYDSGAMPLAQAHFPFALARPGAHPKPQAHIAYPADYIAEGMDQTRGWFYTLLAIATALGYEAPYRNVITFGLINDKFGQKMSKSKGNIVEPFSVMDRFGADAVRWYFYTGTPFGEPKNFDEQEVAKVFRKTHLIVYNSFVFWKTYAKGSASVLPKSENTLDRWIMARLHELTDSVTKKLDHYEIREAALEIETFVDDLSRWYIRRSRRRLQRPESARDFAAASGTLGYTLSSLTKLMAPFTPFFAEVLYAALGGKRESVHLEDWPKADKKVMDKKLIASMKKVRDMAAAGLAKRAEAGIKVRQPLALLEIPIRLPEVLRIIVAEEVNVKDVKPNMKIKGEVRLDAVVTPELHEEGILRELARMIQELRQKAGLRPKDKIVILLQVPPEIKDAMVKHEAALRLAVNARSVKYGKSEKWDAEEATKLEGQEMWIGIRKVG